MEWMDYRKRLGVGFCDEDRANFFIATTLNNIDTSIKKPRDETDFFRLFDHDAVSDDEYAVFCRTTGTRNEFAFKCKVDQVLEILEEHSHCIGDFLAYYMAFVNCLQNRENGINQKLLLDILDRSFVASKLQYAVLKDCSQYFVFPKGAKEMDDELVSQPLEWLIEYPKSYAAFVKALKEYSEATPDNSSDIADKFRKTLETFLREFFGNNAPLEKNKVEYGRYLKSRGVPSEITGNMETLLQAYANFMNGYAKHQDATSLNVLEYLMYQTGNIIRLLITLKPVDSTE